MRRDYSYPLRVAADKYPEGVALVGNSERWTFREMNAAADRLAVAFEQQGLTGRSVVLLLQNEPKSVITYLALARVGAISVPVNPRLLADEIGFLIQDTEAGALIADAAFADLASELTCKYKTVDQSIMVNVGVDVTDGTRLEEFLEGDEARPATDVDPASVATIIYTSGTSGVPKGVERTHDANLWAIVNAALAQQRSPDDIELFVLPLFGIAFIFQVMPMILCGGTTVLDGAFDPERAWELIERHRATRVFLAPTMLDSMLAVEGHKKRNVSSLQVLNTAYEFPDRVRKAALARFGPIVRYMYGLTEAQLCVSSPEEFAEDASNAGRPMGMMRIRIVDDDHRPLNAREVGEIAMEGPSVMAGYHGRPQSTAEIFVDGWLYTGDLGYLDDLGCLHVVGRKKAMIKTGGLSVDPFEVENVISDFPAVREVAIVGVPHDHWGEQVVAFVAVSVSAETSEEEIMMYAKTRIAGFKCPKRVWFVEKLPRSPIGKVLRDRLQVEAVERAGI